jgi:hypothetical protein
VKPLPIVSEGTAKKKNECRKTVVAGKLFISNYLRRTV